MRGRLAILLAVLSVSSVAQTIGPLRVEHAWIRAMPPGARMQAGYAVLRNSGDKPLSVVSASSADYGDVSLHQTIDEDGVSKMQPIAHLEIAAGQSIALEPGGRHLMLMMPRRDLPAGTNAHIDFALQDGTVVSATFPVSDSEPDQTPHR